MFKKSKFFASDRAAQPTSYAAYAAFAAVAVSAALNCAAAFAQAPAGSAAADSAAQVSSAPKALSTHVNKHHHRGVVHASATLPRPLPASAPNPVLPSPTLIQGEVAGLKLGQSWAKAAPQLQNISCKPVMASLQAGEFPFDKGCEFALKGTALSAVSGLKSSDLRLANTAALIKGDKIVLLALKVSATAESQAFNALKSRVFENKGVHVLQEGAGSVMLVGAQVSREEFLKEPSKFRGQELAQIEDKGTSATFVYGTFEAFSGLAAVSNPQTTGLR